MELITQILTDQVTINTIITLVSMVIIYVAQKYVRIQLVRDKVELYISQTLNQIAQIDKMAISGKQKKARIVKYVVQSLGQIAIKLIKQKYGSIQAFVERVFLDYFKK